VSGNNNRKLKKKLIKISESFFFLPCRAVSLPSFWLVSFFAPPSYFIQKKKITSFELSVKAFVKRQHGRRCVPNVLKKNLATIGRRKEKEGRRTRGEEGRKRGKG
jgi:hypothetical protein